MPRAGATAAYPAINQPLLRRRAQRRSRHRTYKLPPIPIPVPNPSPTPVPQVQTPAPAPVQHPDQPQAPVSTVGGTGTAPNTPTQTPAPQVQTPAPAPVQHPNQPELGVSTVGAPANAPDESHPTASSSSDNLLTNWGAVAATALGAVVLAGAAFVRRGNGAPAATSPAAAVGNMTEGDPNPGGTAESGVALVSPDPGGEAPLPPRPSESELDRQAELAANKEIGGAQQAVSDADPNVPVALGHATTL